MSEKVLYLNISFDWIRHAFSCANYLKAIGRAGIGNALGHGSIEDDRSRLAADAALTDHGLEQACVAGKILAERYT